MNDLAKLLNDSKAYKLTKANFHRKLKLDREALDTIEELYNKFMPFILKYKSEFNIGFEVEDSYDFHASIIFSDINLYGEIANITHLRIGKGLSSYFYHLTYTTAYTLNERSRKNSRYDNLIKGIREEFNEFGIYTEEEAMIKDIIT